VTVAGCSCPGSGSWATVRTSSVGPSFVGSLVSCGSCSWVNYGSWAKIWLAVAAAAVVVVAAAAVAKTVEVVKAVIVAGVEACGNSPNPSGKEKTETSGCSNYFVRKQCYKKLRPQFTNG